MIWTYVLGRLLATKNIGLDAAVAVSHKSPAHAADLHDAEAVERHPANILRRWVALRKCCCEREGEKQYGIWTLSSSNESANAKFLTCCCICILKKWKKTTRVSVHAQILSPAIGFRYLKLQPYRFAWVEQPQCIHILHWDAASMNPPCLMSHVAMCIASSIPTKAVTLVVFHQGFVDGVLEVWRKICSMPSHKKRSCVLFYLPGCSYSTFLKTTPDLPEHQNLLYLYLVM